MSGVLDDEALGVAWMDALGRELGSTGGAATLEAARHEAERGLLHIYTSAENAVIYRGRSRTEGEEVEIVRRST